MMHNDLNFISSLLTEIIAPLYGPNGKDALILQNHALITCSGAVVLESLKIVHPFGKLLVDSIIQFSKSVGDGSKGLLLLVNAALNQLQCSRECEDTAFRLKMRSSFSDLKKSSLDMLLETALDLHRVEFSNTQEMLVLLAQSIMQRITSPVASSVLAQLLVECFQISPVETPTCMIVAGSSIQNSRLATGFILDHDFVRPVKPLSSPSKVLFISGPLSLDFAIKSGKHKPILLASGCDQVEAHMEELAEQTVLNLQRLQVSLVICTGSVDSSLATRLANVDIAVISGVDGDDAQQLAALCGCSPHNQLSADVDQWSVGVLQSCQFVQLGGKRYLMLIPVKPCCTVLIHSATKASGEQLLHLWKRTYQVCSQSLARWKANPTSTILIKGGGCFEVTLSKLLKQENHPILSEALLAAIPRQLAINSGKQHFFLEHNNNDDNNDDGTGQYVEAATVKRGQIHQLLEILMLLLKIAGPALPMQRNK